MSGKIITTSNFFSITFSWNLFFIPLLLVCVYSYFWNKYFMGSIFFLNPFSHSMFLIGKNSPFTFKIIISRYVHIVILLFGFWLFLYFLSVFFPPYGLMNFFNVMFIFFSYILLCIYYNFFSLWLPWSPHITSYVNSGLSWQFNLNIFQIFSFLHLLLHFTFFLFYAFLNRLL